MITFLQVFKHYLIEILPALAIGFLISGVVHEFVPTGLVQKHLSDKGIRPILYTALIGAILPVCCWGSLPIALSFYKKGAKLGPVLAFLVATPATSISALLVTYRLLGLAFTVFIFFAVILMGVTMGLVGNNLPFTPRKKIDQICPHCDEIAEECHECAKKPLVAKIKSILKFAFVDMPKEIGIELIIGIILAAIVATVLPIGLWIKHNLGGGLGYVFSLVFGLIMYICSTSTVPLVDAFIKQGLSVGAGMTLLLVGPITSYGTILVLKKEFGGKLLAIYLAGISILSLGLGYLFSLIR
jgi:uncharacterized membrane protein YraQ (UPF0718 family)